MEHLTMKQAQGEILEYVKKHSYNYALLIDGEWGCGKTYFIKNTVIPEIEKIPIKTPEQEDSATENGEEPKTKEVIYASLYGIKSIDDIAQQIMQILAEKKLNIKGKWLAGLKFSAEIIEKIFSSNEGATNQIAGASIQFVSDWENYVMIFDDLERTHLPINEVFGYINQFVEQNNATVILVANEKEIDSALMQENLEQRYLVCLSDSIKYSNEKKPPFTPEDMNERLEDVFGESDRYKKIKEKLIGRTIYFKPDLEELIKQITKGVKDETARKAIEEMIPQIVKIMRQEDHYNLRTYQFALAFLEKVILSMKKKGINRLEYKLISTLLTAILKVAIAYKNGAKNFEWSFMAEYGSIAKEGRVLFGNSFTSFKFIHDYIYYSAYNEDTIAKAIRDYIKDKNQESAHEESVFNKLQVYWIMEDGEVKNQLERLKQEITKDEEYYIERYALLLSELYQLQEIGFEIDINSYVDKMAETIRKHGSFPQSRIQPNIEEGDKLYGDFRKSLDRLYEAKNYAREKGYSDQINKTLENEKGWGEQFYTYCMQNKADIYTFGKFLPLVDKKLLTDRISTGSPKDLDDFRLCLLELYRYADFIDHYQDEEEILKLLHDEVATMSSDSRIYELNRKNIINTLDMILDRIKYQKGEN